jgi:hypothetical protein
VVARYPFFDVANDIALVNGVPMKSFFEQWMAINRAMDNNNLSLLPGVAGVFVGAIVKVRDSKKGDTL